MLVLKENVHQNIVFALKMDKLAQIYVNVLIVIINPQQVYMPDP